ncbi:hypothetical protein ACFV6E_16455 [Streptomyces sp. NPDC059785]|uniref:hypothetical protein n=1 Tax=unclassified Streptomyces TaxID=2593676 RepID=UPI003657146D
MNIPKTPASAGSRLSSAVTDTTAPDHPRGGGDQIFTLIGRRPDREPLRLESPEGVIAA